MDNYDSQLAHSLKIKFGLSPSEPSQYQLDLIKNEISALLRPTDQDWWRIVSKYCPSAGTHKYAGVDNSDLNVLLSMAKKKGK